MNVSRNLTSATSFGDDDLSVAYQSICVISQIGDIGDCNARYIDIAKNAMASRRYSVNFYAHVISHARILLNTHLVPGDD